ncbi:Na(+)/H(+) antiporter nhaA [Mannheimia sp. USDA-ARS-USMARC-1261]|uniref:Na+/H+ antiporter NhaA n=1 Tax=Mannheimia sp. USDA-ARS-USMARC-1261 TaxID=1432056 RepID=UPI0003E3F5C7|nr:Na+/H+ antiporter NhaA [Mannheimia sp. USDA-ARS-USMARC-1261]AHG74268.1 Na(+)/H(+) antiporter nhaA [Mannheimia sp. USDA-ARS-USMARC-1261]
MGRLLLLLKSEAAGGILLLIFAFAAIILANSSLSDTYFDFLQTNVSFQFGTFALTKPLLLWINDGLMAIFFTLVGLEVKRELFEGSLSSLRNAIFPAVAAIGGMVVPALVFWFINKDYPQYHSGWAIPMATDIAFAVGIVALLGARVPLALKVFLLALAIIDDLGAIIVIALFYSQEISVQALTIAGIAIIGLILLNRFKVSSLCAYLVVGLVLWTSVLKSGVHATLAGVIIGFCVPLKGKNGERPAEELEHILMPWCSFMILPFFAFANAGVSLAGMGMEQLTSPLPLGIALGLIIGKTVGVFGFSYLAVLFRLASLPQGVNFKQIFAIAVLCGIGFTMSMFIASLAFDVSEAGEVTTALARLGILLGSAVSAILGYVLLRMFTSSTLEHS